MTSLKTRIALAAAMCGVALGTPALAQGLFGPGKFKVEQTDDRFSTSATTMFIGRNNRVTKKSVVGGIHIGSQGLYMDPLVVKSRSDGKIIQVGFAIENRTELDTSYGSPNSLGSLRKVSFLVDGTTLIAAPVSAGQQRHGDRIAYNTISRSASSALSEAGMIHLQPEQMAALASASRVAIKVEGSTRSWTIDAGDISKSFLKNIRTFYQQQVAGSR